MEKSKIKNKKQKTKIRKKVREENRVKEKINRVNTGPPSFQVAFVSSLHSMFSRLLRTTVKEFGFFCPCGAAQLNHH